MRNHRARKRCGTVVIQDLALKRNGVEILVARSWLKAEAANDSTQVRDAFVRMMNAALNDQPKPQPVRQALKLLTFGLF
jgi:hypothetical protein